MEPVYRCVNGVGRGLLRAIDVDVRWTGAEAVPTSGPVVLAATHVSFPDFVLVERAAVTRGRLVRFMARADVWDVPVVSWFMDRMGHVPVDRQAPAHAYLRARRLLRDGEAVCGFPEAGISFSYTVRPLMRGLVALAREVGVPLVPVGVWGTQRIFSVGDPAPPVDWTRGRRVDLAFGTPMYVAPGDDLTERTHELGHELTGLLEGLQRLPHHRPRPGEVATWYPAHLGGHAPTRREAVLLDRVPVNAVLPSWGPDVDAYREVSLRAPDATG
ncbi:MAG: 1-acyl-sn-glycerol-3-phosphate acyltransferase [Marmoricola sp.]|nr:1-acyl-sn-glycerol-3-phosphate acyltransferase [Marmoricola sp.]